MGGLGKTTLVKKVYDDVKVEKSFQHHAWITVSSSKIEDLLRDLIQQLFEEGGKPVPQGIGTLNADRLKALLNYFLRQKKYIIILDNVNACPPHLNKLSQGILKRCEGLSLAIVAIGGVLATKDQNRKGFLEERN
uniref:NB-ARC domain-containing protein n=1 Tax=Vitis vinifera TaxID=29760 RepID=F6HDZ5_VITVI